MGTPAPGNIPGARYQATTWTDKNGNFWLFGGSNFANNTDVQELNDLWEFNPATREWTWVAGSSTGGQSGVYGTLGVAAPQNTPGSREDASGWVDKSGNLWLFGGYGLDASGTWGILNDLWEFNPTSGEWTWMSGSNTVGNSCFSYGVTSQEACALPSVYGTSGVAATGNTPGSREGAATWTDSNGNLWLFGGWSYDEAVQTQYYYNELWKYNPTTNEWAWMGGSETRDGSACLSNTNLWFPTCGEPGSYGTLGVASAADFPGGRAGSTTWVDGKGDLWLFSGSGFDSAGYFGDPNDLWEFNPSTVQWTWMGGNASITPCSNYDCSGPAVYGTLGTPSPNNVPMGRDHGAGWTGGGNLWLFGGGGGQVPNNDTDYGLNDLWEFNPSTDEWALMGGNIGVVCGWYCGSAPVAVYGQQGVPAPGNNPGNRLGPAGWKGPDGNFWLFGGHPGPQGAQYIVDNDLWEYQPANGPLPTTATPVFSVPTGSYSTAQSVTIGDATNGSTIYYTTDGSTPVIGGSPTTNSNVFWPSSSQPIDVEHSGTLKAIAVASGTLTSPVATATYTLPPPAATPVFSIPSGTYTSFQTVTLSDATPGATIYYNINSGPPTTSSKVYTGPITIKDQVTEVWAMAVASGYTHSYVAQVNYTLQLPTTSLPTFSLGWGTYNTAQTLTLSDSTPGATIYYQINTGYATTSSPVYTGPIKISSTETVYAMATSDNHFRSGDVGGEFIINPSAAQDPMPVFSVPGGSYSTPQTVTISDSTANTSIYYTIDGSTPTSFSTLYTAPITISSSETLKAIATNPNDVPSAVATAAYTITATPDFSLAGTAVNVVPGATTGNTSTVTVTPSGGFTGAISLSCAITPTAASDPATCSIPSSMTISGTTAQTAVVTVSTTAATSAMNRSGGFFRPIFGGTSLALILVVVLPSRRRKWWRTLGMILLVVCIVGGAFGCGGSSVSAGTGAGGGTGGGGGVGGNTGTTPGSYTITVTAMSGSISQKANISLTVQ